MAKGVVDRLETVEIEEQQGAVSRLIDDPWRIAPNLLAIWQAGDGVVKRELSDLAHARPQGCKHSLEGKAQVKDLAYSGRPERHFQVAIGNSLCRRRQFWQTARR